MTVSDDLFQLIKSLNKSEKGYFKKFVYKGEGKRDSVYLKLFDILDKQETFDEEKLKKRWLKMGNSSQLSLAKNYLNKLIMNSLVEYHHSNSVDAKLHRLLDEIAVLYKKGLYQQAVKTLKKARKIALLHEKFQIGLILQRWDEELLHVSGDFEGIDNYLVKGFNEELRLAEQHSNYRKFRKVCIDFFSQIRKQTTVRHKEYKEKIENLISEPILGSDSYALSLKAKSQRYYVLLMYYRLTGDLERSLHYRIKHVKLIENNPQFLKENKMTYLRVISNQIAVELDLKRWNDVGKTLEKLNGINLTDLQEKLYRFQITCEVGLQRINGCGLHEGFDETELVEKYQQYEYAMSGIGKMLLGNAFGTFFFIKGDFDEALNWFELVNRKDKDGILEDLVSIAKILILICHYELGHFRVLHHIETSTYRYLKKRTGDFKLEGVFLKYLRKMANAPNLKEFTPELVKLKQELKSFEQDEFEKGVFAHFDLDAWLDSKIEKQPMWQVLKRKMSHV
ncbi:MAG: hypothetical protein AAF502_11650 [Bacteroidota bacterium]